MSKTQVYDVETKTTVRTDPMVFNLKVIGENEEDAIKIAENNIVECLRVFYQVKSNIPWDAIDKWIEGTITFKHTVTVSEGF